MNQPQDIEETFMRRIGDSAAGVSLVGAGPLEKVVSMTRKNRVFNGHGACLGIDASDTITDGALKEAMRNVSRHRHDIIMTASDTPMRGRPCCGASSPVVPASRTAPQGYRGASRRQASASRQEYRRAPQC